MFLARSRLLWELCSLLFISEKILSYSFLNWISTSSSSMRHLRHFLSVSILKYYIWKGIFVPHVWKSLSNRYLIHTRSCVKHVSPAAWLCFGERVFITWTVCVILLFYFLLGPFLVLPHLPMFWSTRSQACSQCCISPFRHCPVSGTPVEHILQHVLWGYLCWLRVFISPLTCILKPVVSSSYVWGVVYGCFYLLPLLSTMVLEGWVERCVFRRPLLSHSKSEVQKEITL